MVDFNPINFVGRMANKLKENPLLAVSPLGIQFAMMDDGLKNLTGKFDNSSIFGAKSGKIPTQIDPKYLMDV